MTQGFVYKHGDRPLEGYTIQRGAGKGGFGEVYYALSDSGREVALKVVQGYEQIEIRGITQCMNLKSPHLVTIFDVKRNEQGKAFVIMEYVAGPSLRELIDQSPGGLGTQKAAFFLREIGKGLTYLHDCGIVHRDLKPANIFYENGYVKIGDYGLSKAISPTQHSGQTITVGTVHYMAPEIGAGMYDARIDIYALGAVLFEMITGQPPFIGGSVGEILMKHISADPDVSRIEEPFASVIRKAMAKNPDDRFRTVQEMIEAVFGAEHIRNSVSHFSPDSLTMVAGRVAGDIPVAKSGPVAKQTDYQKTKLDTILERIDDRMERVSDRLSQAAQRVTKTAGAKSSDPPPSSDSVDDPFDSRRRRRLAIVTAFAVAVAAGLLSQGQMKDPAQGMFLVAQMIASGVFGIRYVIRGGQMQSESPAMQRLLTTGAALTLSLLIVGIPLLFHNMSGGSLANQPYLPGTFLAALVSFVLIKWDKQVSPTRKERVALKFAIQAGICGFVCAFVFNGIPQLVIGALAGISLVLQIASPKAMPRDRDDDHAGSQRPARGQPGAGPANRWAKMDFPFATASRSSETAEYEMPGPIRALFLLLFIILLPLGVAILSVGGTQAGRGDTLFWAIILGVGALLFSLLCLVKAWQKTYRNLWSSFLKPVIMLLFVLAELAVSMFLGMAHPSNEEFVVAIFLIIFFPILFIVTAAIPARFFQWRRLVPSADQGVAPSDISPLNRSFALLLACGIFGGVAGLHRLYVRKTGTFLLWLFTGGLFGIGQLIDIIMIISGNFRDAQGRRLIIWDSANELNKSLPAVSPTYVQPPNPDPTVKPGVGVVREEPVQPTPVAPVSDWVSRSQVPTTQTSLPLSLLGILGLVIAFLVGLIFSVGVVDAVTAGLPQPALGVELEKNLFGTPSWPHLVERIGQVVLIVMMLSACITLIFARRRAGGAHMTRAVFGCLGLFTCLKSVRWSMSGIDWSMVAAKVNMHQGSQALELFFNGLKSEGTILAISLLLISIMILAWPEKRTPLTADSLMQGGI